MLLHPITFLATIHVVAKDLAFFSPLNNPPRGINGIHEGVAIKNPCLQEGQVEEKDYNTDRIEIMSQNTQYGSQHEKNKQEIKRGQGRHQWDHAMQCSNELGKKVPPQYYLNQLEVIYRVCQAW